MLFVAGGEGDPLVLAARHLGALPLVVQKGRSIGPDRVWRLVPKAKAELAGRASWSSLL